MSAPEIVTYVSMDPDAPGHMTYAAAMVGSGPGMCWMAYGVSPEAARGKLEAIWERQFPGKKRGGNLRKKAEAVDELIVL